MEDLCKSAQYFRAIKEQVEWQELLEQKQITTQKRYVIANDIVCQSDPLNNLKKGYFKPRMHSDRSRI